MQPLSRRDVFHPDDLVLITKHRPPPDSGSSRKPPTVHLLGLVDRIEKDEQSGVGRVAHIHLCLSGQPHGTGFPTYFSVDSSCMIRSTASMLVMVK
jgi:hypothetical protein